MEKTSYCPFCGYERFEIMKVPKQGYHVTCQMCRASGPIRPTKDEAVSSFNVRAEKQPTLYDGYN